MSITKTITTVLASILLLSSAIAISAITRSGDIWTAIDDSDVSLRPAERTRVPENYRTFRLNKDELQRSLDAAPKEFARSANEQIIQLPMPDGSLAKFSFEHSLVVEPGLLKKYPELGATYAARGIDDPTATVRFDFLPTGFHAIILSSTGTVLIDPYAKGDTDNYVTYRKNDLARLDDFHCEVGESTLDSLLNEDILNAQRIVDGARTEVTSGTQLRVYRLALAASNEYAVAVGGNTIAGTLAAQVLIMNRVNGVYERDLAIRMVMIANNDQIVYAGNNMNCPVGTGGSACTSANDPYTNNNGSTMLGENTTTLNNVIQSANYDIGHVFSTGGGGVATLNGPCGSNKARGVTGLTNPVGDPFAIDYVAHEMGHQWGANHTFNGSVSNCAGGNRSASSAYEPGSGVTIMAYAGICGNQNLALNSIDTFHVKSLEVIVNYSQNGNGNTCAVTTATGNTPPTVSVVGGPTFDVPKLTPFTLTATGSDVDGDTLSYDWQEYDLGALTTAVPNTDIGGAIPIFRPYLPSTSGSRTFPSLTYILNNANVPPATFSGSLLTGELMPQIGRSMVFQVVARDNRANGGGINTATATVAVDGGSGPFEITSQSTAAVYSIGSSQAVTWNTNGTTNAPVSAANVKISFSSDGGLTFPTVLIASTPNDGSENVVIPNVPTLLGRFKVEGVGKIFFDINDANFQVINGVGPTPTPTPVATPTPTPAVTPTPTPTPGGCLTQNLVDPSIEASTVGATAITNPNWPSTSTNFESSLCSVAFCGAPGPPRTGTFLAWFGGTTAAEIGTIQQTRIIPVGSNPTLKYWLRISAVATPFNATLLVKVDGTTVQTITEPGTAEAAYTERVVALPAGVANGSSHVISFEYNNPAGSGTSNFLVDDITLETSSAGVCPSPTPSPTPVASPTPTPGTGNVISYTGPSVVIPDNSPAGVNIPVAVGTACTITDLNFRFDGTPSGTVGDPNVGVTHSWVGDLIFTLTSPTGTAVTFFDRPGVPDTSTVGCNNNNLSQLILDDDGGLPPVESQCVAGNSNAAFPSGSFSPNNALSAFDGQTAAGTWTLNVSDNVGADTGTVNRFSLVFTCAGGGATPTPTPVASPTPTPVASPTPTPVASPTPTPVATPTPTPAGTPTPSPTPTPGVRVLRVVSVSTMPGQQVIVPIELQSLGNESSASFSVQTNPAILSNPVVTLGSGVPAGTNLGTNLNDVAAGRIGVLVDSTNTYAAGTRQMITIRYDVAANAPIGLVPVTFGSVPTPQSVSSAIGALLTTTYQNGNVQVGSTAAGVEVSGRVVTPDGRGIRNAIVTIVGPDGVRRTATTGSFGFFQFADVESGQSYVIAASARRYRFSSRVIQVVDTLANIDFVGLE